MNEELTLESRLTMKRAELDALRERIQRQRLENAGRAFVYKLRCDLADRIVQAKIAEGFSSERRQIFNDFENSTAKFRITRGDTVREITMSWTANEQIEIISDGNVSEFFDTIFEKQMAVFKGRSVEEFLKICMKALGYTGREETR